ncbi:MAG: GAF domain-containing sensor histidine kinase [Anaerolineae bacterium]|nr:GAF domain-containing sensor histidine kinase [Anaerolineae bacterium]MDK1081093.1 GAF domain-containing sensor histidine kinase [Anaerolineae bacterium]
MKTSKKASILKRILAVTRDLRSATDMEELLYRLTISACELTSSQAASILKFNELTNSLRYIAAPWLPAESLKETNVPLTDSMPGWVFTNGEPLIIQDVANDSRHFKEIDQGSNLTTTSLIAVPIQHQGDTIGVLECLNKSEDGNYTEDDVIILEMLAFYATLALANMDLENQISNKSNDTRGLDRLKRNFIAIISHELRTPLGLILGHATVLKEVVSDEHNEALETIIRNSVRLKEIIESLSSIDNIESGLSRIRQRSISVPQLIDEVIVAFKDLAVKKSITLKADIPDRDLYVEADADKITIAIGNLIRNAITFTDEGGQVIVRAESVTGNVKVSVTDNGVGIPIDDLPLVFERFFQVESHLTRSHAGLGLGLSVAKSMIELHGGKIWVESVEKEGSTINFLLPIKPPENISTK